MACVGERSGSADRLTSSDHVAGHDAHDGHVSRSQSTSPRLLTRSDPPPVAVVAAAADGGDGGLTSSSVGDVDVVSIQAALRRFSKRLIAAEMKRVSRWLVTLACQRAALIGRNAVT